MDHNGQPIKVSKTILETQMHSADVYSREVPLSRTFVSKVLEQAKNTCFTVQFRCQIDEHTIFKRLEAATPCEIKNAKVLASEILTGREHTIVGHLASAHGESKLGRSLVRDLGRGGQFRLVDHRHILSLIIKDVKYVCT